MIDELLDGYQERTRKSVSGALNDVDFFMNDRILSEMQEKASQLAQEGKMVRGSLILLTHDMYNGDIPDEAEDAAAAIEIIHTALLIHDDVIDRDGKRRGVNALHRQYSDLSDQEGLDDPDHTGTSIAMCAGDIGFFIGFQLLAGLDIPHTRRKQIIQLFSHEFARVGVAEAEDIILGASHDEPTEDEILDLYRNKTARYTFSLPFMAGAILGGADEDDIDRLETIGEKMGLIYQLKDDALDLFGDETDIGKDHASDLHENKKTLHRLTALRSMDQNERRQIQQKLNELESEDDATSIVKRFKELNVDETVRQRMESILATVTAELDDLDLSPDDRTTLEQLGRFCLERER